MLKFVVLSAILATILNLFLCGLAKMADDRDDLTD